MIVGPPNAGKSSLLNALAGSDRAIVTDIAGTTRDLLHETVRLDGVELTLVDTAGLREGGDAIEREGMRRARAELERADLAIVVLDARDPGRRPRRGRSDAVAGVPTRLWLHNKSDLLAGDAPATTDATAALPVSARTGAGLDRCMRACANCGNAQDGGRRAKAPSPRARAMSMRLRRARPNWTPRVRRWSTKP